MTISSSSPSNLFIAIDLDNFINYDLFNDNPVPGSTVAQVLLSVEQLIGVSIHSGFAAMNHRTKEALPVEILNVLQRWQIRVVEVAVRPEAADKDIFYAIGRAGGRGFRQFVVVSKDKGFAEAVQRLRDDEPDTTIHVVVDQVTSGLHDIYACIENVQFIELNPRTSGTPGIQSTPVRAKAPAQAPTQPQVSPQQPSPTPSTQPTASPPGLATKPELKEPTHVKEDDQKTEPLLPERTPEEKTAPPTGPQVTPAKEVHRQDDYVLTCDLCGWRSSQSSAGAKSLCRICGSRMRTATVFATNVVPPGKNPFDDGPVIEFRFKGKLRRTAVLFSQSMTFGRTLDPSRKANFVELGDFVETRNRISREQFLVTRPQEGRWVLIPTGDRPMYVGDRSTPELLPKDQEMELKHGQEFWINDPDPHHVNDAGALIKCIFLQKRRETTS